MTMNIWNHTFRTVGTFAATLALAIFASAQQTTPTQTQSTPTQSGQQTTTTTPAQTTPAQGGQQTNPATTTATGSTTITTDSSSATSTAQSGATGDIVDTATKAGSFTTLAKALDAAGLTETLKGAGPFTVFAPTDEAFAKLPAGALDELLKPENKDKLKAILTYHVVSGKVMASDVAKMDGKMAKTVQGGELHISTTGGVKVDNATVTQPDIAASNGVIHVIDTVLMPSSGGKMKGAKKPATR